MLEGLAPPWIAGELNESLGVVPVGAERFGQGGFEVFEALEDPVGKGRPQRLEPALGGVELGAVRRQEQALEAGGPAHPVAGVAAAAVEDDGDPLAVRRGPVVELIEEHLEAVGVGARQEQRETGAGGRLDGDVEPEPVVAVLVDPGRPVTVRAPAPPMPDLQSEPGLVKSECPANLAPLKLGSEPIF